MTKFNHLTLFFVVFALFGANVVMAQTPEVVGATTNNRIDFGKVEPIVIKIKQRHIDLSKQTGIGADILSMGYNPGCPDDVAKDMLKRKEYLMKRHQVNTQAHFEKGFLGAAEAGCFGSKVSNLLNNVKAVWIQSCAQGNVQNIGNGGLKAMAGCMATKIMNDQFQKLQKLYTDPKNGCKAWQKFIGEQIDNCVNVGFHLNVQKPQFRSVRQCLVNLDANVGVNLNLNSFTPLKDSSITFSGSAGTIFAASCGGANTISDLPTALLTPSCWKQAINNINAPKTCGKLDPAIENAVELAKTAGDNGTKLLNVLKNTANNNGTVSWQFVVSGAEEYETNPVCYGYTPVANACAPKADGTTDCPAIANEQFCCDPSQSSCANSGVPICPNTCCDKDRNNCEALGVAQCQKNASCIGNMEKVFAYGPDGSKIDTGKTAGDEQIVSAETSVWTKLKHQVKPDREIAGKACCSTPWCNLCPQQIVLEDYRLQGKPYGFGPGVILPEGMAPPPRDKCMPWRHLPTEVMQYIFENRPGDKYATSNVLKRMIIEKVTDIEEVGNGPSFSIQQITEEATKIPLFEVAKGVFKSTKMQRDIIASTAIGMNQMIYQPLFAEGMPVNYAKVMVDGEVQDVGLCSDLDFCPIDYVAPTGGGNTGIGSDPNAQCSGSSNACRAQCGSDTACYNSCCGISGGGGTNTNVNTNNSDGSRGGGTVVNTDGGGTRGGSDAGSSSGGTTTNGPSGGGTTDANTNVVNEEAPKNDAQMIVPTAPVNPTTQGAESPGIVETLKGLF